MKSKNNITNKFSLAGDAFMHLKQQKFTHRPCKLLTKDKERTQKFK